MTRPGSPDAHHHLLRINGRQIFYPVGWRLALHDPTAVAAVITQNGDADGDGFVPEFWEPPWTYAADPSADNGQPLRAASTLEAFRWQYAHGVPDPSLVSPDMWHHDYNGTHVDEVAASIHRFLPNALAHDGGRAVQRA